jgi:hypothetical protein
MLVCLAWLLIYLRCFWISKQNVVIHLVFSWEVHTSWNRKVPKILRVYLKPYYDSCIHKWNQLDSFIFNVLRVTLFCVFQWVVLYFISNSRLSDKSIRKAVVSMHILNVLGVFVYNCFNFWRVKTSSRSCPHIFLLCKLLALETKEEVSHRYPRGGFKIIEVVLERKEKSQIYSLSIGWISIRIKCIEVNIISSLFIIPSIHIWPFYIYSCHGFNYKNYWEMLLLIDSLLFL